MKLRIFDFRKKQLTIISGPNSQVECIAHFKDKINFKIDISIYIMTQMQLKLWK